MIPAGLLIHTVTLLAPSKYISDDTGQTVTTFRPVVTVPARIVQASSTEGVINDGTLATVIYTVTIRYVEGIAESWRVSTSRGRTLDVSSVVEQGSRQIPDELIITAIEVRT